MMTPPRHVLLRAAAPLALTLFLAGCDAGPKSIRYGQDECAECKMTLVDQHYGAELITPKGKILKFDDLGCLRTYQQRAPKAPGVVPRLVVIEFNQPNTFLPVEQAFFLRHDRLRSPMGSGTAAFVTEAGLEATRRQLGGGGQLLRWPDVMRTP